MPGANCSIHKCNTSRRHVGISIFKLPKDTNDINHEWREELINVVKRGRVMDENLKRQIEQDTIHICEKHFSEDQIFYYPNRKMLKEGMIPSLNLPPDINGDSSNFPNSRTKTKLVEQREAACVLFQLTKQPDLTHNSFEELTNQLRTMLLPSHWMCKVKEKYVVLRRKDEEVVLDKFEIFIDQTLNYTARVYGWLMLDEKHDLYTKHEKSLKNVNVPVLLNEIDDTFTVCNGLDGMRHSVEVVRHVIPKVFTSEQCYGENVDRLYQVEYMRSKSCKLLIKNGSKCKDCKHLQSKLAGEITRKNKNLSIPAKPTAPLSNTSPERLKLTIKALRAQCKQLEDHVKKLSAEFQRATAPIVYMVPPEVGFCAGKIYEGIDRKDIPKFMKLFWNEQQQYFRASGPTCVRYHPMIVRFCLHIIKKYPSFYDEIRYDTKKGTGIFIFPSPKSLRSYDIDKIENTVDWNEIDEVPLPKKARAHKAFEEPPSKKLKDEREADDVEIVKTKSDETGFTVTSEQTDSTNDRAVVDFITSNENEAIFDEEIQHIENNGNVEKENQEEDKTEKQNVDEKLM